VRQAVIRQQPFLPSGARLAGQQKTRGNRPNDRFLGSGREARWKHQILLEKNSSSRNSPWLELESGAKPWETFDARDRQEIVRHYAPKIKIVASRLKAKLPVAWSWANC